MMAMDMASERPEFFYDEIDKQVANSTQFYLALPILSQGRCLGVSTYVNRSANALPRPFDETDMDQARRFAPILGVVLNYLDRSERLNRRAAAELTGCLQSLGGNSLDFLNEESEEDPLVRLTDLMEGLPPDEQNWAVRLLEAAVQRPQRGLQ